MLVIYSHTGLLVILPLFPAWSLATTSMKISAPRATGAVLPSPTPFLAWTNTPTLRPTTIPPTLTATLIPPTNAPTAIPPTETASEVPPPPEPPPLPDVLYITSPAAGAGFNCAQDVDCTITVTVQWISDTQAAAQGRYLSIWVKPYPGDPVYLFSSQTQVTYLGDGLWQSSPVYLGQKDVDGPGTPFAIYAIISDQPYPTDIDTSPLPPAFKEISIEVTR